MVHLQPLPLVVLQGLLQLVSLLLRLLHTPPAARLRGTRPTPPTSRGGRRAPSPQEAKAGLTPPRPTHSSYFFLLIYFSMFAARRARLGWQGTPVTEQRAAPAAWERWGGGEAGMLREPPPSGSGRGQGGGGCVPGNTPNYPFKLSSLPEKFPAVLKRLFSFARPERAEFGGPPVWACGSARRGCF